MVTAGVLSESGNRDHDFCSNGAGGPNLETTRTNPTMGGAPGGPRTGGLAHGPAREPHTYIHLSLSLYIYISVQRQYTVYILSAVLEKVASEVS